jgi:hypothetical protein
LRRGGEEERRRGGFYELREDTNLGLMVIFGELESNEPTK